MFLKKRTDDNIMKSCMYVIYSSSEGIQQKSEWDWEWVENALWKTQNPCRPSLEEDYVSFGNSPFSWPLWPDDLCHPNLLFFCVSTLSQHKRAGCAATQLPLLKNISSTLSALFFHPCLLLPPILLRDWVRLIRIFWKSQICLRQPRHINMNSLHPFFFIPRWAQLQETENFVFEK